MGGASLQCSGKFFQLCEKPRACIFTHGYLDTWNAPQQSAIGLSSQWIQPQSPSYWVGGTLIWLETAFDLLLSRENLLLTKDLLEGLAAYPLMDSCSWLLPKARNLYYVVSHWHEFILVYWLCGAASVTLKSVVASEPPCTPCIWCCLFEWASRPCLPSGNSCLVVQRLQSLVFWQFQMKRMRFCRSQPGCKRGRDLCTRPVA